MNFNFSILDSYIKNDVAFAIFRLPLSQNIELVVQKDNKVFTSQDISSLNQETGFILSPFDITKEQPLVIIRPDFHLIGVSEIGEFLQYHHYSGINGERRAQGHRSTSRAEYEEMFNTFYQADSLGRFQKIVLSKQKKIEKAKEFSPVKSFEKALSVYPNAFVFLAHTPVTGTWLGSTPELFLSREDETFRTVALAGTRNVEGLPGAEIEWNEKNRKEQQIVADYFSDILQSRNIEFEKGETYTYRVGNLAHLKTDFKFKKKDEITVGQLMDAIHPSPAVCGFPKDAAFEFIKMNETQSRSYYSGIVGNLNLNNRIDLYVNLRCMHILDEYLVLYAGGGILKTSNVGEEWNETEDKMGAMMNVLN